ncbi:DUF397 domain-containing protein [Streptomyces sp. BE303]|nr:DUF397 domain-containing protein [Streptomyces sp. BE303]MED7948287.1 DUF397 domain-containing protein [Streptomyces sp. BE303]
MAGIDRTISHWRRSTYSQQGGNCVEVALGSSDLVPVRDSKDPSGPALVFPVDGWRSFVTALQAGEFGEG